MEVSCGIVSVVGADEYGSFLLKDYEKRGIDTAGLYVDQKEKTFYCIVFVDDSGEKYLSAVVTPLISPDISKIDYEYVKRAEYVHMCSMDYELVSHTVDVYKRQGLRSSSYTFWNYYGSESGHWIYYAAYWN